MTRLLRCVLLVILLSWSGVLSAEPPAWQAGIAKAKITPDKPLWLAGYASRTRPAEGTLHDLWIKVLALQSSDGHRAVVVTSDLLGFPKNIADKICQQIQASCGLERSQIMLTCSHTHSGPVLDSALSDCYPLDDAQRALIDAYSRTLEQTVAATVVKALADLRPATLWTGVGKANFAANRRNNREPEAAKLLERGAPLKGPVDHAVPVLVIRSSEGRLRAMVFGYACHNTTLCLYEWCGDYAGFAQIALEQKHPEALAMFWEGCGADQNPMPRRSVALCQKYGEELAKSVDEVITGPLTVIPAGLKTTFATVDLGLQPLPSQAELQAKAAGNNYSARWAKRMLALIAGQQPLPKSYPYPVQVWRLGPTQLWIALGGEVVVDYALKLKAQYGPQTWVTGYANNVMAYIPSRRVWEEGGYEQGAFEVYGMSSRGWTGDIEQQAMRGVDRLVQQLGK
jgi:hypothetical protein